MRKQSFYQHKAIGLAVMAALFGYATTTSATHLDAVQQELNTQRQQWQMLNVDDYIYYFEQLCYCPLVSGLVHVVGGEIDSVEHAVTGDVLDPRFFLTVDGLFDEVQAAIDSHADEIVVKYDGIFGNPTTINIDFSKYVADEEMSFRASDLRVTQGRVADYNDDGFVDAADYTFWRDTMGQTVTPETGADGDADGFIGLHDYGVWASNFGWSVEGGSEADPIPELSCLLLVLMAWLGLLARRYR